MRKVEQTHKFQNDFKRVLRGTHRKYVIEFLPQIVEKLCQDQRLDTKYFDHPLKGNWRGHRECHLRPDLLLIYRKPNANILELTRIGSHSELGL